MNDNKFLNFYPIVDSSTPAIKKMGKSQSFMAYEVKFILKEMPENFKDRYLVWIVDKKNVSEVEEIVMDGHPSEPYHTQNPIP